jgi:hypothetical protein
MPAFQEVLDNPARVTMLLLCIFGAGFMIWFLTGLIAERSRARAKHIVRVRLGEGQSVQEFPDQVGDDPFFGEAPFGDAKKDRASHVPVHGFRIRQHF